MSDSKILTAREPDAPGSAREQVHKAFRTAVSRGQVAPFCYALKPPGPCGELCELLTAAIERDRTATIEACALRVDDALCEDMKCRHAVCIYLRAAAARIRALDTRKG